MSDPELSRLLAALADDPADDLLWLAVADLLEEGGEPARAELMRLGRRLRGMPLGKERRAAEKRLGKLLVRGVRPCVPEMVNGVGMRLALIPAGSFWMGAAPREKGASGDERPRREVTLTRAYWLGVFPVTQREYAAVMGRRPSYFSADGGGEVPGDTGAFPVEQVSWDDAVAFCAKLSKRPAERKAGRVYRLPTEAEWEHACRAGMVMHLFAFGAALTPALANFNENGRGSPCPVGAYPPNGFGLHDMHGNVWEWCSDHYEYDSYRRARAVDPLGTDGSGHAARGGGWDSSATQCRSAFRYNGVPPADLDHELGFRLAMTAKGG